MKKRPGVGVFLRRKILERDGACFCQKCGRVEEVVIHHVVAAQDGGLDDLENLTQLCKSCHSEWHSLEMVSDFKFEEWLKYPTLNEILPVFKSVVDGDKTLADKGFGEVVEILMASHALLKEVRRDRRI